MKLITAIVRPEKLEPVTAALAKAGFNGYSRWEVRGARDEGGVHFTWGALPQV